MGRYCSKDSKYKRISKLHNRFKSYNDSVNVFVHDKLGLCFVFHLFFTESAFTGYEDETFKEIFNLRVQRSKLGGKMTNFAFFFYSRDVVGFVYSNSGVA